METDKMETDKMETDKKTKINKKVYIDMDGVLCDFVKRCKELLHIKEHETMEDFFKRKSKNLLWATIRKTDKFWSSLDPVEGAIEAFEKIYNDFEYVSILSSPDLRDPGCVIEKNEWLEKWLPKSKFNYDIIYEKNKYIYANSSSILIDDMSKNIDPWIEKEGTGILFTKYNDEFWETLYKN